MNDAPRIDLNSEYDYSHFDYLNDQFESEYKETVIYVEENYEDYDSDYQPEEDEDEKMENSKIVKQLKERFSPSSSSSRITLHCWIFLVGTFYIHMS